MTIEQRDAMPVLLEACPSFASAWSEHLAEHGDDLQYVAAGAFARHLLKLHQAGRVHEFAAVAAAIERLHVDGSPWVKEFATIGILESVQNVWSHSTTHPEAFRDWLGPESQRYWQSLNDFWAGRVPYVGAET